MNKQQFRLKKKHKKKLAKSRKWRFIPSGSILYSQRSWTQGEGVTLCQNATQLEWREMGWKPRNLLPARGLNWVSNLWLHYPNWLLVKTFGRYKLLQFFWRSRKFISAKLLSQDHSQKLKYSFKKLNFYIWDLQYRNFDQKSLNMVSPQNFLLRWRKFIYPLNFWKALLGKVYTVKVNFSLKVSRYLRKFIYQLSTQLFIKATIVPACQLCLDLQEV